MATTEAITLPSPVEAGGGHAVSTERRELRVSVEQYLHRVGWLQGTLMVVETFEAEDGSRRRAVRYVPWPGL